MKYKYLILLTFFSMSYVCAADGLGRLFYTPDQRAELDVVRAKRDPRVPTASDAEPTASATPQGPEIVTYSGAVRRSDGKSTVWINGKPLNERNRIGGPNEVSVVGVRSDGAVAVTIPQADRRAALKVGQSLDVTSGRIEESYKRRAILAPSPPPIATAPAAAPVPDKPTSRPTRPLRESDFKESDSESGAAPAERLPKK